MTPELAQKLGTAEGQGVEVTSENQSLHLPLRLDTSLPADVVGLPAGFPGIPAALPAWVKLEKGA
jgi:NADH-quinone oxidoreductase subunit G